MASSNKREGSNGIDFGADFSELHERPILKDADLELPTPIEVATPAITTWVTPLPLRYCSRSVPTNAPHVRLVTR